MGSGNEHAEASGASGDGMKHYYRDLFDSIPEYWDEIYGRESFYGDHYRVRRDRIEQLMRKADLPSGSRILDVGCGAGGYFPIFLDMEWRIVGVDAARGMIKQAKSLYADHVKSGAVTAQVGDVEHLDFPDNSFDAVNCAGVLMYLPNVDTALREIYRVLRPGGVATLNTDNHRTLSAFFDIPTMVKSAARKLGLGDSQHISASSDASNRGEMSAEPVTKTYRASEFRDHVRSAGFEVADESGHGFDRIRFNGKSVFPDSVNKAVYNLLDPLYRVKLIGRAGMTYTVLARK